MEIHGSAYFLPHSIPSPLLHPFPRATLKAVRFTYIRKPEPWETDGGGGDPYSTKFIFPNFIIGTFFSIFFITIS